MNLKERIESLSEKYYDEIIRIRRHIHANPELSFEEFKTSGYIQSLLEEWGISFRAGIVKTGILARIEGRGPGKNIAFRADMDALPVTEQNDVPYRSAEEGKMHACGHDVHTASLLGALKVLNEMRNEFSGTIQFIFQPGEERIPGGAKLMLEEDLFEGNEPELVIAQHVYPDLPTGIVGFRKGMYMASSDEIYITIKGKGGHAALPHKLTDPVLISSHLILALQQITSRHARPGMPTVLSIGKVEAKGAVNIIPDEVKLEGTFRTMNEEWRAKAHSLIRKTVQEVTRSMGGEAELEIRMGYPVLSNDPEITSRAEKMAVDFLGEESVEELDIRMTAEDFAYFSQKYPSVLFRLGTSVKGEKSSSLHSSTFNVNEESIKISMGLLSWMGINFLDTTM